MVFFFGQFFDDFAHVQRNLVQKLRASKRIIVPGGFLGGSAFQVVFSYKGHQGSFCKCICRCISRREPLVKTVYGFFKLRMCFNLQNLDRVSRARHYLRDNECPKIYHQL